MLANARPEPSGEAPPAAGDERWRGPTPEQIGEAVALLWDDRETDEAIARRLGISRRTLARWKQRSDFGALWAERRAAFLAELQRRRRYPPAGR